MTLRLFDARPVYFYLAVCLLIVTTPFVLYVVTNLKSDYVAGLFFVLAAMCVLALIPFNSRRARILWSIGFGSAAILSKPTGIHIPVILGGTLFLGFVLQLATLADGGAEKGAHGVASLRSSAWKSMKPFLLISLGISAVVLLFMWGRIDKTIGYILWQMNPDSGYYAEARSIAERLSYRLPLTGNMKHVWGVAFYWFVAVTTIGNGWVYWRGSRLEKLRSASFLLVVVVTYTATVATPFSNLSFASLFFFSVLGYSIYMLSVLANGLSGRYVAVLSMLLVVSTVVGYAPKSKVHRSPDWTEIKRMNQVFDQLVADINDHSVYTVAASGLNNGPLTNHALQLHADCSVYPGVPSND